MAADDISAFGDSTLGDLDRVTARLDELVEENRRIHERESLNLDPASNVMNPRAEALLSAGLSTRPSLGVPGEKYETGLEAIEQIELLADDLVRRVFQVKHVELRVASGAIANLYAFMATCQPGDTVIVPPAEIGGHVTHHRAGAAGLYGLNIVEAPVDADRVTVDVDALAELAQRVQPRLITIGGSLNLSPHPVGSVREVADSVGAHLLFDAAHLCGMFAGRRWESPLTQGAHLMTMSTYKSLGGPPAGIICTDDDTLAERITAIAHPGLTANFDVAKTAALALTMLDWIECGAAYADRMVETARALACRLREAGLCRSSGLATTSPTLITSRSPHPKVVSAPLPVCVIRTCWPAGSVCRRRESTEASLPTAMFPGSDSAPPRWSGGAWDRKKPNGSPTGSPGPCLTATPSAPR